MEYTFKKDFGFFKANDVLTWDEDLNAFTMDVKEDNSFRSAMIDEHTVEGLYEEGILTMVDPKNDKIDATVEFIFSHFLFQVFSVSKKLSQEKAQ